MVDSYAKAGGVSTTVIVIETVSEELLFVALMVYNSGRLRMLGEPVIAPVVDENCNPFGSSVIVAK